MKKMRLLCILMVVLAIGAGAQAAIIYETGFETTDGFSDGVSVDGVDGWVLHTGSAIASSTHALSGDLSLEMQDTGPSGSAKMLFADNGLITVEFLARPVNSTYMFGWHLYDDDDYGDSDRAVSMWFTEGKLKAYDGGTLTNIDTDISINTTYSIKIVADAASNTFNMWLDGNLKTGSGFNFRNSSDGTLCALRMFRSSAAIGNVGVIDDLVISDVPEPATMALLGLGSLVMLCRKRS
ncbi:MAG: PEP-CTERM sorting domain-containing protein [Anaerohalosphaeraceae bacterium]|nr:PEP-CTERM sorting domain-containing protein [Anaerohalosphaeraceae bacterium]